jgi:RimJ/RimL family protein N-acetyltransferase
MGHFRYGVDVGAEYRGRGYGREAVEILLGYFFNELRYHKCTVGIYAFNEVSIKFHESLGFMREGTLRDMVYTGGRYYDELHYGITDSEYAMRHIRNE